MNLCALLQLYSVSKALFPSVFFISGMRELTSETFEFHLFLKAVFHRQCESKFNLTRTHYLNYKWNHGLICVLCTKSFQDEINGLTHGCPTMTLFTTERITGGKKYYYVIDYAT